MSRIPLVIEGTDNTPPQILNEDMMTPEEAAAAHQVVEEWYAEREQNNGT